MIASVQGYLLEKTQDAVVIQVGGIGLRVFVPRSVLEQCGTLGEAISLFTHLHVRENEISLYGCATEQELEMFKLLLGVSGIGPKVALAILSHLDLDQLRAAIAGEQTHILSQVPGIGPKTAKKIVLDLKDRVSTQEGVAQIVALNDQDSEVIAALTTLGYSLIEAQTALQHVPSNTHGIENRLKAALSYLGT